MLAIARKLGYYPLGLYGGLAQRWRTVPDIKVGRGTGLLSAHQPRALEEE
jgi:hypothetical protein